MDAQSDSANSLPASLVDALAVAIVQRRKSAYTREEQIRRRQGQIFHGLSQLRAGVLKLRHYSRRDGCMPDILNEMTSCMGFLQVEV